MDILAIILFVLFVFLSEVADKKKRQRQNAPAPSPTPAPTSPDAKVNKDNSASRFGFKIPEINAKEKAEPTGSSEIEFPYQKRPALTNEYEPKRKTIATQASYSEGQLTDTSYAQMQKAKAPLALTPEQALSALAFAEILGKPRAYRYRRS